MSKIIVPSLLRLLDLLIDAFHLDEDANGRRNELHSRGSFQAYLTGRSLDLSDDKLDVLLLAFSKSLLDAGVFPALRASLRADLPTELSPQLVGYLGEAVSLPRPSGDLAQSMARRLKWLHRATEDLLGQSRAQEAAAAFEPRYAMLPLIRFLGHHLTIALALLHTCGHVDVENLRGTIETSWGMSNPTLTPISEAGKKLGLSQAEVAARLSKVGGVADDKTIANLWHGGSDHPRLETLCAMLTAIYPDSESKRAAALPAWRRWYGLRYLGRQLADLWGWDVVCEIGGDVLVGAQHGAGSFAASSLSAKERNGVASCGVWAGWHLMFGRWLLGNALHRAKYNLSPTVRDDYLAIAECRESLRLQQCLQISSGGANLEAELRLRGRDEERARFEALKLIQGMQSDCPELVGLDPLYDFHFAMAKNDLPRAEAAARTLVDGRPDLVGNHGYLVAVLTAQDKFDEALAACQQGLAFHHDNLQLLQMRANTLMEHGHERGSRPDFMAARDLLATPRFHDCWGAQLDLADCHFALGDWSAARASCDRCVELHDECGEAFALDSICSLRLGDQKRANKSADYASRRGASQFLAWLREHAVGSANIAPPPRWHRMRYQ